MEINVMKKAHQITKCVLSWDVLKGQDYQSLFNSVLKATWKEAKEHEGGPEKGTLDPYDVECIVQDSTSVHLGRPNLNGKFYPKEIHGIKRWILDEKFFAISNTVVCYFCENYKVIKETAKAVEVEFDTITDVTETGDKPSYKAWVPKSQLTSNF